MEGRMNQDEGRPAAEVLRRNAEKRLQEKKSMGGGGRRAKPTRLLELIHELEVHQIELEMQNDELRRTQAEAEVSRALYAELFDFAPLSYFTLEAQGLIVDVNLAGTQLLGWGKAFLLNKSFQNFLCLESRLQFGGFLSEVLSSPEKRACELHLLRAGHPLLEAHVEAILQPLHVDVGIRIQLALLDVTERKRAESEKEALLKALEDSLAKVKRLSGMLPICSSCKRIRDDQGYWQQVEEYIRDHSEAEFSHGICPECTEKLYPELRKPKGT
jgi:PAS domain S-box-containing protein